MVAKNKEAKSDERLSAERIFRRLGCTPPHSSGALRGDVRDAERMAYLREIFKDAEIPKFLTVPMSKWDKTMTAAAKNDPFKALATLHAIQKRVPGVSDSSLYTIWVLRHPDFCREIYELSNLNDNGDLPYAAFRGADSLEAVASVFLSDGFLPFEDHSGGGIYATALAAVCGVDGGVVEVALRAFEKKSKAPEQPKRTQADDATFTEAVRKGVKEEGKPVAVFPYDGIVGGKERVHKDRFEEKTISEQLFGRFGRELVLAAVAALNLNVESMSEDKIVAAVKTKLAVYNRVFMSESLFTALAMKSGAVYRDAGKGITAFEQDFEGIAAALTGGMIKTGGMNVKPLGCEAEWWASKYQNDAHFAFCFLRDVAFAKATGGDAAAFYEAYDDVKTRLAMEVFSDDLRMMERLAATSVLLKEEGPDALAKADAEIFRLPGAECPTYDTITAGTFARALAAESGRKGGASTAKLVSDFNDPEVAQSPEEEQKAKNILQIDLTQAEKDAHVRACEGGGGVPRGGFSTQDENDAHAVAIVRGKLKKRGFLPQDPVADDNPAGALRGDAPGSASDPAASPAGDGAQRFTGKKKDPKSVRGALTFIEMDVPLICSECETKETSRWYGSKADRNKPVCDKCYTWQLAATRGDCAVCERAGAVAGKMRKSRFTVGAWLCGKCWRKEAPADRVCASCPAGVDTVLSWCKSKRIEGAPWLCNPCYLNERTEIITAAGTTCSKCGSNKTSAWRNSPDVPGGKMCKKCWDQDNPAPRRSKKQKK